MEVSDLINLNFKSIINLFVNYPHRSEVELSGPASSGVASGDFDPLIEVTFPKICKRITHPI